MPKPSPSGLSRLVSGLRSDHRRSLLVQTGFPTSLADLVVKQRRRLAQNSHNFPPFSSSDAAADLSGESPTFSTPASPSPFSSPASQSIRTCRDDETLAPASRRSRVPVGVVLVQLLVLAMLVIERRKLVVGITVLAFGFWLLDRLGFQVRLFLRPCSDLRNGLGVGVGDESEFGFDERGLESPIRDVGIVSYSDITGSERSSFDLGSTDLDQRNEVFLHWESTSVGCLDSAKRRRRKKRLFEGFSPKKSRSERGCDGAMIAFGDRNCKAVCNGITEEEAGGEGEEEDGDGNENENVLRFLAPAVVVDRKRACAKIVRENACRVKPSSYQKFEFFAIILLGLLGGKSVALVLTLSWFLFCKFTEFMSMKRLHLAV